MLRASLEITDEGRVFDARPHAEKRERSHGNWGARDYQIRVLETHKGRVKLRSLGLGQCRFIAKKSTNASNPILQNRGNYMGPESQAIS